MVKGLERHVPDHRERFWRCHDHDRCGFERQGIGDKIMCQLGDETGLVMCVIITRINGTGGAIAIAGATRCAGAKVHGP